MKRLLLILILTFSFETLTKADDIRDFEIEGVSIGDSLYDFLDIDNIKKDTDYFYENSKYGTVSLSDSSEYDRIQLTYDVNNKIYQIHGISGVLKFPNNIEQCKVKMKKIVSNIELTLGKNVNKTTGTFKRRHDKSGKSIAFYNDFEFNDKSAINIYCTDWSEEITKENNWNDELKIAIYSIEFSIFLSK